MYAVECKEKALELRNQGYSINEIVQKLGIAKATASVWVRGVVLSERAKRRLENRLEIGRKNYYHSVAVKKAKKEMAVVRIESEAYDTVRKIHCDLDNKKLLCALLFWAEGGKSKPYIDFTNSDPNMIRVFLHLLRDCFNINESKLYAIVHIHEYHNDNEIKHFWSDITKIPLCRFYKSYKKPHTGIRKKEGYKGCLNLNYYDFAIALELHYLYNAFARSI